MKNDRTLEKDVQDAFKWDPLSKTSTITVTAQNGLITLSGMVKSYSDKLHAEQVTKSIDGVKGIIESLTVEASAQSNHTDADILNDVIRLLKLNWLPLERIEVEVEKGNVTLNGQVTYNFQKEDAKKAVSRVEGVKVFTNNLELVPETHDQLEKRIIEHALLRYSATVDQNIRVKVDGNVVTLNGSVTSLYQKEEAEKIAWNAPGVLEVNNELLIE